VTGRTAAGRYARALFDVSLAERSDLARVKDDLAAFAGVVASHDGLTRVFGNPAIPASRKRAIVSDLIERGAMLPTVNRLLLLVAERDRLVLLPEIVEAYERRLMDHLRIVRAEVVTAVPLPDDRAKALEAGLASATGRQVRLETRVDPAIIGGAVARVGSTVYDGSITRQLERMREALTSAAE